MTAIYKLIWGDFCSWYLEWMKPAYGQPIPAKDLVKIKEHFDQLLRLLHPFMPFITEKLWQNLNKTTSSFINQSDWPTAIPGKPDAAVELCRDLISLVRSVRNTKNISPKIAAKLSIKSTDNTAFKTMEVTCAKLANVALFQYDTEQDGLNELLGTHEINIAFDGIDLNKKDVQAIEEEIKRLEGFLVGIDKKLGNERFIANANEEVVNRERQKKADTLTKLESLKKEL